MGTPRGPSPNGGTEAPDDHADIAQDRRRYRRAAALRSAAQPAVGALPHVFFLALVSLRTRGFTGRNSSKHQDIETPCDPAPARLGHELIVGMPSIVAMSSVLGVCACEQIASTRRPSVCIVPTDDTRRRQRRPDEQLLTRSLVPSARPTHALQHGYGPQR